MLSAYDLCDHPGVEYEWYDGDPAVRSAIDRSLAAGTLGLLGEVGAHPLLLDDPRAHMLILNKATDAYEQRQETDTRTTAKKLYTQMSRIDQDLLMQCRCEYYYPYEQGMEEIDFDAMVDDLNDAAESADASGDGAMSALYAALAVWTERFAALCGGGS